MRNLWMRLVLWASAGFLVSVGWGLYFASASKSVAIGPMINALARFTQPAVAAFLFLKPAFPLGLLWVIVANAATYALLGVTAETIRHHHRSLRISN
ncbi:MAG: hypothetical protein LAP40_17305 [Acidobacteriia bacterium]|nr:hypothetical protein [Terriglobia bacterium]